MERIISDLDKDHATIGSIFGPVLIITTTTTLNMGPTFVDLERPRCKRPYLYEHDFR